MRLDPTLRERLENSFAWHDYAHSRGKIAPDLASPEERAALPPQCWRMAWKNPANGRVALYLASHAYAIEGMEQAAAQKLLAELIEAATAPGLSYVHIWRNGDVVMWDNPRDYASRSTLACARGAAYGAHNDFRDRGGRARDRPLAAAAGSGIGPQRSRLSVIATCY
jgi:hypothetical protein